MTPPHTEILATFQALYEQRPSAIAEFVRIVKAGGYMGSMTVHFNDGKLSKLEKREFH